MSCIFKRFIFFPDLTIGFGMSLEFRTLQPEEFYRQHLEAGERPDGRGLLERRPVSISRGHIGTADGSAVVKCGQTSVVCGIRAELTSPHPDRPQEGFIVPNFSFSTASLAPSNSLHLTQQISQFLLTVLSTSGCVDLSNLCVEAGLSVWVLYVDLLCLDNSGNLLDTSVTAMTSALETLTLPRVNVDQETKQIEVSRTERSKLNLNSKPSSSTVVTFSNPDNISSPFLLSDPTEEEEQLSNSQVTVVTVEEDVCHVVNPGGDLLTPTILQQAVKLAFQRKSVCEKVS